jgi:hypothetical protein
MADVQVVLNQTLNGQQVRNVLHFFYSGAIDADGRQDIADYIRSSIVASQHHQSCVEDWSLDSVSIRDATTTGPYALVPFTGGPLVGTAVGSETISQVAMLVTLINSGLTPPTRGRIYLAGVQFANLVDGGTWPNSQLDRAETLANSWISDTTGDSETISLRIASRNPDGTANVLNVVDNIIVRSNPATQRRRRIGVGA